MPPNESVRDMILREAAARRLPHTSVPILSPLVVQSLAAITGAGASSAVSPPSDGLDLFETHTLGATATAMPMFESAAPHASRAAASGIERMLLDGYERSRMPSTQSLIGLSPRAESAAMHSMTAVERAAHFSTRGPDASPRGGLQWRNANPRAGGAAIDWQRHGETPEHEVDASSVGGLRIVGGRRSASSPRVADATSGGANGESVLADEPRGSTLDVRLESQVIHERWKALVSSLEQHLDATARRVVAELVENALAEQHAARRAIYR